MVKNKKYNIDLTVPIDLETIIEIFREEACSNPEEFAKKMVEFGYDGDWTLEIEYMKALKRSIKADFGKETADMLQKVIDKMENSD